MKKILIFIFFLLAACSNDDVSEELNQTPQNSQEPNIINNSAPEPETRELTRFEDVRIGFMHNGEFIGFFDTVIQFIGYAYSQEEFDGYADILFDEFARLHLLFDIYNSYEGINNLYVINNAGGEWVDIDDDVLALLEAGILAHEITGGATNIAMGSVLSIWHDYRTRNENVLPQPEALLEAADFAYIENIEIEYNSNGARVRLREPQAQLDVGALAKGFAAGLAMEKVQNAGMLAGLLSAGGHVVAFGERSSERPFWNVAVENPDTEGEHVDVVSFTNASLSVSGGYHRFFEVDGVRYPHIIDPATLMPANKYILVAVWHEKSWMTDILSTALFVLPIETGYALAEANDARVLWVDAQGRVSATDAYLEISRGFGSFE